MTKIKILRVISRMNIGGPAIHVTLLTEKLQAPDYESILVTGSLGAEEGDMMYYAHEHGVSPVIIPHMARSLNPFRDFMTFWRLYRLMVKHKPDIVHTHTSKAGFVGRWAAKLAGVPVIVHTFHGHTFHSYFSPAVSRVFITLEQITAKISDTIIALTQGLRRELTETYHITRKERMIVLPLGLDLERFARTPRKEGKFREAWGIPADAPLIGIAGRFVPIKNHPMFLEAAAMIKAQKPNAHFVMVGDGELRHQVEAKIKELGLTGSITLTGWQEDMTLPYADMNVFVMTSLNEGTPVTVIEALAAGCPVVATAVGGLPDLLDGGAFGTLVPSRDVEALTKAILQMLDNPPNTTAAQNAMLDRYGIDRLVRDLDSLYKGLLTRKRKG
jgi:glycosyltransferase involved in cell wall biosynthesis